MHEGSSPVTLAICDARKLVEKVIHVMVTLQEHSRKKKIKFIAKENVE